MRIFATSFTETGVVSLKNLREQKCIVEMNVSETGSETDPERLVLRVVIPADLNQRLPALQRAALQRAQEILGEQIRHLVSVSSQ